MVSLDQEGGTGDTKVVGRDECRYVEYECFAMDDLRLLDV